jgi:PmbA protein
MKTIINLLSADSRICDYKINIRGKESYELFFVKGRLETVRCSDTCDKEVTVYVAHGEYKGEAQFFVYPSTTEAQLRSLIDEAVEKAMLINNQPYELPAGETGSFTVESNFAEYDPADLAALVANTVFEANDVENAGLNSVEVFINKHTDTVCNSRGLEKTQVRYSAMVEAIPTYNGESQSVELYEQYNFASLDEKTLRREIGEQMAQVKARYYARTPEEKPSCPVILNKEELSTLFWNIAGDLNYASVYSHSNLWKKGDPIQKNPVGDVIGITMAGEVPGSTRSAKFDGDGMALGTMRIVDSGKAANYYGSNRFGQYLGETPTGELRCLCVDPGTAQTGDFENGPYLEVVSMSGLQVDFYSDYIGGEIRLAYYHDGSTVTPVTGISISGALSQVLDGIRLSSETTVFNGYAGPEKAILTGMKIF